MGASEPCDHLLVYLESFWCFQLRLVRLYSSSELCPAPMALKKRMKTNTASTSRAQAARGNASLPYVINKYNIVFMDAEHAFRYDAIVNRKLFAPSYLDREMPETVYLYVDLRRLLGILGWKNFV